ncbi:Lrp/AsnC family transcriptional regulator [Curvibacter sp. APW13]|uniref:siroheme decarboxylase subunit beta n=1 Tax=Curvibacter sp. APW13 TaxID=3077236 RepID=UPI0028E08471|nr:Lrp/AsnC family transcriptional regulator [Curvibacter sp. APW13]MDT8991538.1 Lrp/AsnC family transcriptional regulator [Curvibacter sp. APW13]
MALPDCPITLALLSDYQHGFPLCEQPFATIAAAHGLDEADVLARYQGWLAQGRLSRIGPVFAPQRVGTSLLAAISVPPDELAQAAARVSAHAEVNHNYEREHDYNLWFVVTAPTHERLDAVLDAIETECQAPVLRLPLVEQYHIDLGFSLHAGAAKARTAPVLRAASPLTDADRALIAAMQSGLPLCPRPYAALAAEAGSTSTSVLQRIADWLADGTLKRFGVVLRHHELGFTANAMVVHDIPDAMVSELGQRLGQHPAVTLCYRRPRVDGRWRYNLFCMVHGRERAEVERQIAELRATYALHDYPHAVLFSRERFKQQGACYSTAPQRRAYACAA